MNAMFWLAVTTLTLTAILLIDVAIGARKLVLVRDLSPLEGLDLPAISIITTALNEEDTIEPALASLLALDYPNLEIIAVNDRSTDNTGVILERMAQDQSRLKVLHISKLPEGWLGKNHAMQYAAGHANGEYLLFADADVSMQPDTLRRVMRHVHEQQLDHLALMPDVPVSNRLLGMMILDFIIAFLAFQKPWKAKDQKSRHYIGFGAFNLVRANTYRKIGMHGPIAMHPVDDVMLGKLIKQSGYRQDVLVGHQMVSVPWYGSAMEMIRGAEKNAFAFLHYSVPVVIITAGFQFMLAVWPWLALFLTVGATWALNACIAGLRIIAYGITVWRSPIPNTSLLWAPVVPLVGIYTILNATLTVLINRGIDWRGTHYPLTELKKYRI